jgi:hypothetical protein
MILRHFSTQRLASHQDFVKFVSISQFDHEPTNPLYLILFGHRLTEFEENRDERAHPEELAALRMEANTWGLLQALIP